MKRLPLIVFILVLLLAVSCGSKKKLSSRESETIVYSNQNDVVLNEVAIINARILTDSIGKRTTYTPVDPDKPSRVGNTTFENATITREDTDLHREENRSDTITTELQDKSKEKGSLAKQSRETETDITRQSPWFWGAMAGAVVLIVYFWIRYKSPL